MAPTTKLQHLTDEERERYVWLLEQIRSAPVDRHGAQIFDLHLALPPAKTVEESIDLARRPFVEGQATIACFVPETRHESKVVVTRCEPISVDGYERFRFGAHLEPGHSARWHVTEFSTGASVSNQCPTRDAAIAKARGRLGKDRPEYFQQKLDSWRDHAYARAARAAAEEAAPST